jgi:hypothetical protein
VIELFETQAALSNRVLTGRGQNFPNEPICVRAEILFPTVSQRTELQNSDGIGTFLPRIVNREGYAAFSDRREIAVGGSFLGQKMHFSS